MKVVILAGGYGTRISEESYLKPKPMVEIGGKPIIWHIMKEYSYYGYNDFIICCGYKQHMIKEWFANYYLYNSDITFDFTKQNNMIVHNNVAEPWKVTLVDTGLDTMTGGRIKKIEEYVKGETFFLTYGDGVCDIDLNELERYHREHGKIATITAVNVDQRFGVLSIDKENSDIKKFREKSHLDGARINGGYMVLNPEIFEYLEGDDTVFEQEPLKLLAKRKELKAYKYDGFWQCMDTKREMDKLNEMVEKKEAPWIKWD